MKNSRAGFSLVLVLSIMSAVLLLVVAVFSTVRFESMTASAYDNAFRAELAADAGVNQVLAELMGFYERDEVGGAAFTTWSYCADSSQNVWFTGISSGRPEETVPQSAYLNDQNTVWLGTLNDPDELWSNKVSADVVDLNADGGIAVDQRPMLARWVDLEDGSSSRFGTRYAVYVMDETGRIPVQSAGGIEREAGFSAGEIGLPGLVSTVSFSADVRKLWKTALTALRSIDASRATLPNGVEFLLTPFSWGYDVMGHVPSLNVAGGETTVEGYPRPLRGGRKMNLNWSGHVDSSVSADERVKRLASWMRYGAPEFFRDGAPGYWPSTSSEAKPDYDNPLGDTPFPVDREQQLWTIAASMIDYLDEDVVPTQPDELADWAAGAPAPGLEVKLLNAVSVPEFFGADRCPRLNEVQMIWNSEGAVDNYVANPSMKRRSLGNSFYEYEIPVTYRFELWNMDQRKIPPASYAIRVTNCQVIRGSAFGAMGAEPVPDQTELVFDINYGNPIGFEPNEIRVIEFTRTYIRESIDRGTTWDEFREMLVEDPEDDEKEPTSTKFPAQKNTQAAVLFEPVTQEWYSSTCYLQMSGSPTDGVVAAGLGNSGSVRGNRVNDPRLAPLHFYYRGSTTAGIMERDGASNMKGTLGRLNNRKSPSPRFFYQELDYWADRPAYDANNGDPEEGVTSIANGPFASVGELGRIIDPGWTHPDGRGDGKPYHKGIESPFHGGGSLAVGRSGGRLDLADNGWNLVELFGVGEVSDLTAPALSNEMFCAVESEPKVNPNSPHRIEIDGRAFDSIEALVGGGSLQLGKAGAPDEVNAKEISAAILERLVRGGNGGVGGNPIDGWKSARPFFSTGELSELEILSEPSAFQPAEQLAPSLAGVNRSAPGRNEVLSRFIQLSTTRSYCYRLVIAGERYVRAVGGINVVGRHRRELVIGITCEWDEETGELRNLEPQVLYSREL